MNALTYLGSLPDDTIVYDGHEYTSGNAAFAASVRMCSSLDCKSVNDERYAAGGPDE